MSRLFKIQSTEQYNQKNKDLRLQYILRNSMHKTKIFMKY